MRFFLRFLRNRAAIVCLFLLAALVSAVFPLLYQLPSIAALPPFLLNVFLGILFLTFDFFRVYKRHRTLTRLNAHAAVKDIELPAARNVLEQDYRTLLDTCKREFLRMEQETDSRYRSAVDYYTVWAHQIKTPIAAMKLTLQGEDTPFGRRLKADLFRIEQYTDMVLAFLLADSSSTDYVLREHDLDGLIRAAVRKFSGEFIDRKLTLSYEPLGKTVLTDEKWFSFILEQILSNALKYTKTGGITVTWREPDTLCVADTGIGIAPEDLPRIFERGYTGHNGRMDKHASGIGLYLCRLLGEKLGISLSADSAPGHGTTLFLTLSQHPFEGD